MNSFAIPNSWIAASRLNSPRQKAHAFLREPSHYEKAYVTIWIKMRDFTSNHMQKKGFYHAFHQSIWSRVEFFLVLETRSSKDRRITNSGCLRRYRCLLIHEAITVYGFSWKPEWVVLRSIARAEIYMSYVCSGCLCFVKRKNMKNISAIECGMVQDEPPWTLNNFDNFVAFDLLKLCIWSTHEFVPTPSHC